MAKQPGLDGRHRNNDRETRAKRGDTLLRTLRQTYGDNLLEGTRSDKRLDTILEQKKLGSLDDLLRREGKNNI